MKSPFCLQGLSTITYLSVFATSIVGTTCAAQAFGSTAGSPRLIPLTTINSSGDGYMADPQPVRLDRANALREVIISGTTHAVLQCSFPVLAECFSSRSLRITGGSLQSMIAAAGGQITNIQNVDLFQNDRGEWHAAVTIGIRTMAHPKHWTVVAHAHPVGPVSPDTPPNDWAADTLLAGSLTEASNGNYDGKYYEEEGRLYLLYVRGIAPPPALRNEIVLQPMQTEAEIASLPASVLLTPGDRDGELNSEWYANTQAKLVEAPYLSRVAGKYLLVYSTGAYLTEGYKTGVAWSDSLMPVGNGRYRKVLLRDAGNVWGPRGRLEVRYLLQSQKPQWPNFVGKQVVGPGVAAALPAPDGQWWLYLNGFAPSDMPEGLDGKVQGSHRRPFGLRLRMNVPSDRRVDEVSDSELATWIQPQ